MGKAQDAPVGIVVASVRAAGDGARKGVWRKLDQAEMHLGTRIQLAVITSRAYE